MSKRTLILLLFILLKFVLQYLLVNPTYDLHRDEFLHLDQGDHLAWGYISVPPFTSWISYVIKLLGNGVFWVKFFPALFGALTIVVVWKIIEELEGGLFALVLGALSLLVSVMLRINILYQPNSFDIFFWTLLYYTLIKYVNTEDWRWLYALGGAAAFGILSKYNILFLMAGLIPAILLTRHRRIFANKHLYGSMAVAFVLVLPNLLWQYNHHFPTLGQLNELSRTQLVNVRRADFIKDQVLYFLSSFFVVLGAFIGLLFYSPFRKYRFILISFAATLSLFLYLKAKSYYAIGLYPVLIAFGSVYLEAVLAQGWRRHLRGVAIGAVTVLAVPFILIAFPLFSPEKIRELSKPYKSLGLLRWEDGQDHQLPQDFADMIGWSELAGKVDAVYSTIEDKEHTLVLCDNYGQAGAINYYSKFKSIHAVSFNADYINWMPLDKPIKNVILVKDVYDTDTMRREERALFSTVSSTGENDNPYSRERGTRIYLLKDARTDINQRLREELKGHNGY